MFAAHHPRLPHLPRLLASLALATLVLAPCAQAKKDLFGSEPGAKHSQPAEQFAPSRSAAATTISSTEAAQRAQTFAEGQVINVRLQDSSQEGEPPRYAVKLLQKNGRMKTINIDATNGALIEDAAQ